MTINYVKGDATLPKIIEGKRSIIVHCVNTLGAWGAGFVVPLGKRYPQTKEYYHSFLNSYKGNRFELLGTINLVADVAEDTDVVNLFGQERIYPIMKDGKKIIPLNYDALRKGFSEIVSLYKTLDYSFTIHMPKIGCGLAGGDWNIVEQIIKDEFINKGIEVYVYDFK